MVEEIFLLATLIIFFVSFVPLCAKVFLGENSYATNMG